MWVESNSLPGTVVTGEIGVLTDVKLRGFNPCRLFLTMHLESRSFSAVLFFDDQSFCLKVFEFLKSIDELSPTSAKRNLIEIMLLEH